MPTSVMKTPLLRVASRTLAAQAAAQPQQSPLQQAPNVCTSVLANKTVVTSIDQCGALSRVSLVFRAGARNETSENRGVAHVVRSAIGLGTTRFSGFGMIRNVQQNGGQISCTSDREFTIINLVATRDKIESLLPYLSSVGTEPAFKPWEIADNTPRIKYEISGLTAQTRAIDILHKAAYRTGLGNSIFVKKDHLGSHDTEQLQHFYRSTFTANRLSVVGLNVEASLVSNFAQSLELSSGDPSQGNATFYGGEVRKDKKSHFVSVALATEGVSLKDQKSALTFAVLQNTLGTEPNVIYGGSQSPLGKAAAAVSKDGAAVGALNISYSDSGLFGVFISTTASNAGRILEAANKVLRSGSVSDADVARGKAQLKAKILEQSESSQNIVEDAGVQNLLSGGIVPATVVAEAVDKISAADVNNAARKIASGKWALGGFGNLTQTPYLDQLK